MSIQHSLGRQRRYLPRAKLKTRYGVTEMSIWRWERDPLVGFPDPIIINGKKFYDLDELEAWEDRRRARSPQAGVEHELTNSP